MLASCFHDQFNLTVTLSSSGRLHELKAVRSFDCNKTMTVWRQSGACTVPTHEVY